MARLKQAWLQLLLWGRVRQQAALLTQLWQQMTQMAQLWQHLLQPRQML
jgi:hypothetical protein